MITHNIPVENLEQHLQSLKLLKSISKSISETRVIEYDIRKTEDFIDKMKTGVI